MDLQSALINLRDPMGVPFFPWLFQGLMVLTFALHIVVVNLVVGGIFMAVYHHFKGGEYGQRLSKGLARASTVNLSLAIVLGVAPLLFVQVIYDPFWYVANTLSAWWAMAFLLIIILGFLSCYVFYLKRQKNPAGFGFFGIAALIMVVFAGGIMSVFAMQQLLPEQWKAWYIVNDSLKTLGTGMYAFEHGRFLHFMVPAFINIGIYMMLYAWYFRPRTDIDQGYLDWVGRSGARLAKIAAMVQVVIGFWWLFSVPLQFSFYLNPLFLVGAALGTLVLVVLMMAEQNPDRYAVPLGLVSLVAVLGMSTAREVLRMNYLGRHDYSIYTYPVSLDLGSTALFLVTFVMGLIVIAYPIIIAFKLGRGTLSVEEG
ncbi:MAG: hypothetical protein JXO49_00755 [Deltaproteobacteria bacterium]|nr:hypothetical protein [Candidatus Anaeroferrophillus wilburensis]MBN2887855.1 hypothetical protein [Deltaproteobacteria bacterium]